MVGADLLVTFLAVKRGNEENEGLTAVAVPDWVAMRRRVLTLSEAELNAHPESCITDGKTEEEIARNMREQLFEDIDLLETAIEDGWREVTWIRVGGYDVWLTGGMSYGDSPTDLFDPMNRLLEAGIEPS
jgi:hypothetical protein